MIHSKKFLLYTVALIIVGALIGRGFSDVGLWLTIIVLCVYSAAGLASYVSTFRHFRRYSAARRFRAIIVAVIALFTLTSIFTKDIPYFAILALLAVEYLYRDENESSKE